MTPCGSGGSQGDRKRKDVTDVGATEGQELCPAIGARDTQSLASFEGSCGSFANDLSMASRCLKSA